MINSLILILNKEENPMTRGRGVDFGQNFDDVIFEQPPGGKVDIPVKHVPLQFSGNLV